jgi:hypothetical protein
MMAALAPTANPATPAKGLARKLFCAIRVCDHRRSTLTLALLLLQLRGTVGHLCTTLLVQGSYRRQLFFHGHDPHGHSPHGHSPSGAGQCSNTCNNYASDGDCDDGSPGSEYSHCTLGTDCYDCGPRLLSHSHFPHSHSPPSPPLPPPRPRSPWKSIKPRWMPCQKR